MNTDKETYSGECQSPSEVELKSMDVVLEKLKYDVEELQSKISNITLQSEESTDAKEELKKELALCPLLDEFRGKRYKLINIQSSLRKIIDSISI